MRTRWIIPVLLAVVHAAAGAARAQGAGGAGDGRPLRWQSANIGYLAGFNWSAPNARRDVLTFEYANRWRYGDNFLFIDIANLLTAEPGAAAIGAGRTATYGEWHARLSLGGLLGRRLGAGPLADILIANEVDFAGTGMLAHLHGIGADWNVPGFAFLRTHAYVRDDIAEEGRTWQILASWLLPLRAGGLAFTYGGFIDVIGSEGTLERSTFSGTQLLLDAGGAVGAQPGRIFVGSELHYARNQGGVRGSDDTVPQLMVKWIF